MGCGKSTAKASGLGDAKVAAIGTTGPNLLSSGTQEKGSRQEAAKDAARQEEVTNKELAKEGTVKEDGSREETGTAEAATGAPIVAEMSPKDEEELPILDEGPAPKGGCWCV
jgi:hypothetical protein